MFRYAKELLLVVFLLLYSDYYLERLNAIGWSLNALVFGAMFLALTLALYLAAYIRQALVRHAFALTMFAAAVFFDVYTRVTADYLRYSDFVSLVYSGGFIQEAAYQYRDAILRAVLRAGSYELEHRKDVPGRVVVSEYVDVAHAFVEKDETGMVNAVLDQIARQFRADEFARG